MSIVTITSDFGNINYNLGALKGTVLTCCDPKPAIIDISNDIDNFNIVQGAFVIGNCFRFFPAGSIHVIAINTFYSQRSRLLLLKFEGHYFLAPNNGILPLLFEDHLPGEIYDIGFYQDQITFFNYIGLCTQKVISNTESEFKALIQSDLNSRISLKPTISGDSIRGSIVFIDKYGNLITNIKKSVFEQYCKNRSFAVYFRHKDPITKIHLNYHEVPGGDELCLFNMAGFLEIAINLGNASEQFSLQLNEIIQIDFFNETG
jgi:S-adenosyl-L-methionine hydrolase (adenosine-forming)